MTRTTGSLVVAAVLAGAALLAAAERPKPKEDDLAVVKRAVAQREVAPRAVAQNQAVSAPARPQAEVKPMPRAAVRDRDPQWFKIRVVEKATGKRKVTVNLPLAVVRALGDDMPIDWPCGDRDRETRIRSTIKLSEVLSALEAGQDLVQVDDDESEVRIWVE
jgi:hypothetical protein